jgi:hypothetical protein
MLVGSRLEVRLRVNLKLSALWASPIGYLHHNRGDRVYTSTTLIEGAAYEPAAPAGDEKNYSIVDVYALDNSIS